jgi:hypothetical protein
LLLLGADSLMVHFVHPALKLTDRERGTLAGAFTPAASPHYSRVRAQFPWAMGLIAALGIYVPKGLEAAKEIRAAKERAKLDGAEPAESSSADDPPAGPVIDVRSSREQPADVHPLFGDTHRGAAMPFGGPAE